MSSIEDDMAAIMLLKSRGYRETQPPLPAFHWQLPTPGHVPTDDENEALTYLFNEWDYGGVIGIDVDEQGRCIQKEREPQ